ncbi:MAG TPA: hypothetical protein DEO33_00220 [Rikenellaceae bacterium]|nr:hypothetical protein [Rikenellaceae bacterium]
MTLRNVAWFKNTHLAGELDIKPPFQRNPVWVERQKSYLLDSILHRYPIPEIYMQETVSESGETKYTIVDGQQRIRSVLEFLEGKFPINAQDSPQWADMRFDDLKGEEKKRIYEYNFVVRLLPDIDDEEIRTIFQRLNKNTVALNKQELRQATYWGSFIALMNKLSDKEYWSEIDVFSPNDVRRMLDVEYISEIAIAALHGPQNKKQNLDKFYEIYEDDFDQKDELERQFDTSALELIQILPNIGKTRWSKKTDFYTLFLILIEHNGQLPLAKDRRDIAQNILLEFGNEVDQFVRAEQKEQSKFSVDVKEYASGIRASTDLASRKRRQSTLEHVLSSIWD